MQKVSRRRSNAIVVMDTKSLDVVHVYVRMSLRAAMIDFVGRIRANVDQRYSDMKDELSDALERYTFESVQDVTIGRRYD